MSRRDRWNTTSKPQSVWQTAGGRVRYEKSNSHGEILLTAQKLGCCLTRGIGFNKKQAELLGVDWPLTRGWRDRITDSWIAPDTLEELRRLRRGKPVQRKSKRKKLTPAQRQAMRRRRLLKVMQRDKKIHAAHCNS